MTAFGTAEVIDFSVEKLVAPFRIKQHINRTPDRDRLRMLALRTIYPTLLINRQICSFLILRSEFANKCIS